MTVPPSCVVYNYVHPYQQDSPLFFCGKVVTENAKCSYSHLADEELQAHPPLSCKLLLATFITKFSFRCSFNIFAVPLSYKVSLKIFILSFVFTKGVNAFMDFDKTTHIMKEDIKLA